MLSQLRVTSLAAVAALAVAGLARAAESQDAAGNAAIRKSAEHVAIAINAGKSADAASMFLANGELIDENGVVYRGRQEIESLLDAFFKRFPGAKLAMNVESVRIVGPVAIDEGTRTMTTADGELKSRFRYIAVWANTDDGWRLASFRDFVDDPAPTAHDNLQPLAWLEGDWINEGADGEVAISYHWSEDKNYLLGEFQMKPNGSPPRKSSQRIGWDPSTGNVRVWLFDADGGFAEGTGAIVDGGLMIKSASVNPDGTTATATMNITSEDDDHFTIEGTDRIVGGILEDDFEITVTRRPPAAGN